jgi:DNA-binding NarL/FixJ family response regulator
VGQFDPAATARVVAALTTSTVDSSIGGLPLTARETDVLRLIARGATNREIATDLHLGEGTVKNHISRILTRLGLRDRTQAALYAREHGLS